MKKKGIVHVTSLSKRQWKKKYRNYYAGKWCDPQNDNNKHFLNFSQHDKDLTKYIDKNLIFLKKKLNNYHNTNFSNNFWKIILYPWLNFFAYILYDRFLITKKLLKLKNIEYFLINKNKLKASVFENYLDYTNNQHQDYFNNNIFHDLLKINLIKNIKLFGSVKTFKKKEMSKSIKVFLKNKLSLFSNKNVVFYDCNISLKYLYKFYYRYFVFNSCLNFLETNTFDKEFREFNFKKKTIKTKNDFQELLNNFSIKYLPKSYLESFKLNLSSDLFNDLPKNPKIILTGDSVITDDLFKIWFAKKKEKIKNIKLISFQTGANFLFKRESVEDLKSNLSDLNFNWGKACKLKKNSKIIGYKKDFKYNNKDNNGKILYICSEFPLYYYKNISVNTGPSFEKHILLHERFLSGLNEEMAKKLYIKPYFYNYGWNAYKRLKKINKSFKTEEATSAKTIYQNYDIVICAVPSTAFFESIYLNIPTVTLFDFKSWQLNHRASLIFKKLHQNYIHFDDPKKASQFLNLNLLKIQNNWNSKKTQKILNYFRNEFIMKNDNYCSDIIKIIDGNPQKFII